MHLNKKYALGALKNPRLWYSILPHDTVGLITIHNNYTQLGGQEMSTA